MEVKQQTAKDKIWRDHQGMSVPYNRTSALERLQERNAFQLLTAAQKAHDVLEELHKLVQKKHQEVLDAFKKAEGADLSGWKGNKVWYNFDRSIQVECRIGERMEFDDLHITAARKDLDDFLRTAIKSEVDFVQELIALAFATTNGKLDPKRVTQLLSFRHKIKHAKYQSACELIEKSIKRVFTKVYFMVGVRNEDGKYDFVQLNFSKL